MNNIQLITRCPVCEAPIRAEMTDAAGTVECPNRDWSRDVPPGSIDNGKPQRCLACGCGDLWRQKDFPQGLGLLLVAVGALASTIAWAYMRPVLAIGILMAFALADMLLFLFMHDVLVCYRCKAKHRRVNFQEDHPRFDLATAERYRQEAIRLQKS